MPKMKTFQAAAKRFKKTGTKKLTQRKGGQDHFNAREAGQVTRAKRSDLTTNKTFARTIKALTPYN